VLYHVKKLEVNFGAVITQLFLPAQNVDVLWLKESSVDEVPSRTV
jgi:hypothetical protein